jgi:hypothetical protein
MNVEFIHHEDAAPGAPHLGRASILVKRSRRSQELVAISLDDRVSAPKMRHESCIFSTASFSAAGGQTLPWQPCLQAGIASYIRLFIPSGQLQTACKALPRSHESSKSGLLIHLKRRSNMALHASCSLCRHNCMLPSDCNSSHWSARRQGWTVYRRSCIVAATT